MKGRLRAALRVLEEGIEDFAPFADS